MEKQYMQRCIELAKLGKGAVFPNPMVGAVLVYNDKIISEGYHSYFGGEHAEINCFNHLPLEFKTPEILEKAILYVNLEPCCHYGKTPPCTEAILKLGIKKVVIGLIDPHSLVNHKGINILKNKGVEVITPILEEENKLLNKRFLCFHQQKRPYIILKWAACLNGNIAAKNFSSVAITNQYSNFITHQWRSSEMAIMVGTNTVLNDNPKLTVRNIQGKNPIRIILDRQLKIPKSYKVFESNSNVYIFNEIITKQEEHLNYVKLDFDAYLLNNVFTFLYAKNISSVIIEGGAKLQDSCIKSNLWDEARVIKSNSVIINDGLLAARLKNNHLEKKFSIQSDDFYFFKREH